MFRMLTNEVLFCGIRKGYTIVTYIGDDLILEPFEKEIYSTVFVPGPIAILNSSAIDEFVLDDMEMFIGQDGVSGDKKRLDDYLKSSSLYYNPDSGGEPVFLKIGNPCQIIPIS